MCCGVRLPSFDAMSVAHSIPFWLHYLLFTSVSILSLDIIFFWLEFNYHSSVKRTNEARDRKPVLFYFLPAENCRKKHTYNEIGIRFIDRARIE